MVLLKVRNCLSESEPSPLFSVCYSAFLCCFTETRKDGSQELISDPLNRHIFQFPVSSHQLQNQTELRVTCAERAAFFLDAALAERRSNRSPNDQEARRNSHFLFTLHLYQERPDKSSKATSGCQGSDTNYQLLCLYLFLTIKLED